jgi:hypothetical protein
VELIQITWWSCSSLDIASIEPTKKQRRTRNQHELRKGEKREQQLARKHEQLAPEHEIKNHGHKLNPRGHKVRASISNTR